MASERNYDELFAEMLMSIDRHTEELNKHSQELTRVSLELAADRIKHDQFHERLMQRIDESEERMKLSDKRIEDAAEKHEAAYNRHLEMILNTATILDRIIKQNHLKL